MSEKKMSGEQRKSVKTHETGAFLASHACSALTKSGKPCRWPPIRSTNLCAVHTPGMHDINCRKGGKSTAAGSRYPRLECLPGPKTPQESMEMLSQMLAEVRAGRLDPQVAQAAKGLHYAYLRAF